MIYILFVFKIESAGRMKDGRKRKEPAPPNEKAVSNVLFLNRSTDNVSRRRGDAHLNEHWRRWNKMKNLFRLKN